MKKNLMTVFVCFFLIANLVAQSQSISLGSVGVCDTESIIIPLKGKGLVNIGAITILINYQNNQLVFSSLENINPQIEGLLFNVISNPSRLSIVWSSTKGATFSDDLLLNLKFNVLTPAGELDFAIDSCEIADLSLPPQILTVNYNNGFFYPGMPNIERQPENQTVNSQTNVSFSISSSDATGYQWFESPDSGGSWSVLEESVSYKGTHTDSLIIQNVPVAKNNHRYRCSVHKDNCFTLSHEAVLLVDSIQGFWDAAGLTINNFIIAPNPFSNTTRVFYNLKVSGYVKFELVSLTGGQIIPIVERFHEAGQYIIDLNFVYLPRGLYHFKIKLDTRYGIYTGTRKIEKI